MARTYKRDANGRFAGGGGSTRSGRPAARPVSRGKNRITRDNAGRIASVGGEGATARGGRLRTAAGNKRAVQTARIKGSGGRLRKPVGGGLQNITTEKSSRVASKNVATGARNAGTQKSRAESRALANYNRALKTNGTRKEANRAAITMATATRALESLRGVGKPGPRRGYTSKVSTPKQEQKSVKGGAKGKRSVSTAQVERMMERVGRKERNYQAQTKRLRFAKEDKGAETKQRAVNFLYGKAGFEKEGKTLGRVRWKAPKGMTTEQATKNIATGLSSLQRRSTARTGNKKIVTREDKRAKKLETINAAKRSVFFQRSQSGDAQKGLRLQYPGSTGRGSSAMKSAARRQSKRRETIRTLRGLGPSNSTRFSRGSARQQNLFGGTTITYGKPRRRR